MNVFKNCVLWFISRLTIWSCDLYDDWLTDRSLMVVEAFRSFEVVRVVTVYVEAVVAVVTEQTWQRSLLIYIYHY